MRRFLRPMAKPAAFFVVAVILFAAWYPGSDAARAGFAYDGAQSALPPAFASAQQIGDFFPHGR